MLMPGWYPCIPGWHLDDVPRTRADGQPDHVDPAYRAEHVMSIVGDASRTRFGLGQIELPEPDLNAGATYGIWHQTVEDSSLKPFDVEPGTLVEFNDQSWHKGMPATKAGWRWFIRATRNTHRRPTNEIRRQVQVYLPAVDAGW